MLKRFRLSKPMTDPKVEHESNYVLIDYRDNSRIKSKVMTRSDAARRNAILEGTGIAWALCSSVIKQNRATR